MKNELSEEDYAFIASLLQQVPLPSVPLNQMSALSEKVVSIVNKCIAMTQLNKAVDAEPLSK